MKKKSVVILILVSFWLMYTVTSVGTFWVKNRNFFEAEVERRKQIVDFYLDLAAHFLMNRNDEALIPRLERARELNEFDFFILRKKNEVLGFYNKDAELEEINHDFKNINQFWDDDEFSLKTIAVYDYKLTIGINKAEGAFLTAQFRSRKYDLIQVILLVTFFVFLIVYFILKDILQISKILQSRDRSTLAKVNSLSKEAEVMIQAASSLEQFSQGLKSDNRLLSTNLAPAIQRELESGRQPPYGFHCTLVRVDLNGYTQLFIQETAHDLLTLLSKYFQQSRDVIERYEGLIYQYVGDETIFLIKGDDPSVTETKALGAVRALFEVASSLTSEAVPQGLRLKASLVSGELQFVKLDDGHAFSGLPLIASVRMLGQVVNKSENSLIFFAEALDRLAAFCGETARKTAIFKGFQAESHLIEVQNILDVEQVFGTLPLQKVFAGYRSDSSLVFFLGKLKEFLIRGDRPSFFSLFGLLSSLKVRGVGPEVVDRYCQLLQHCLDSTPPEGGESRELSSVVSLSQVLLASAQVDGILKELLDRSEQAPDPRVQANTLSAKAFFGLEIKDLPGKIKSTSNRLAADAILVSGERDFSQELSQRVQSFLRSEDPKFIASGLFLIAEITESHYLRDLVYLKANSYLKTLIGEVPKFLDHENEMVRNRAKSSHSKIQRLGLYENRN